MATFLMVVLAILTFGNPIILVGTTVLLFNREHAEGRTWRASLSWIALVFAVAAVALFWAATRYGPSAISQDDVVFRRMLRGSFLASLVALILAMAAKGKERKWIALSALINPLSWFWALMMI